MKPKLTLEQEKEIYENEWREVYNDCFLRCAIDKEKISCIMYKLNVVDQKLMNERKENGS